jgi:hypothetical protein
MLEKLLEIENNNRLKDKKVNLSNTLDFFQPPNIRTLFRQEIIKF